MDREELLELITTNDVIEIMTDMGSEYPTKDSQGNLYFTTICHGGDKHKLHYFVESKFFKCYTNCGSMSIFDVLMNINGWKFTEAINYLLKFKNIKVNKMKIGLQEKTYKNEELDFLNLHLQSYERKHVELPKYDDNVLNIFNKAYPDVWEEEGIKPEVMDYFNIRYYLSQQKGIIPHYDLDGNLVGVKARNFFKNEVEKGKKYIPITIQGLTYRYHNNFNLYGLYQNKETIRIKKKAILFESEKSVLKYASIYGQENNITLASLGMGVSIYQRDLILDLGIEELTIAYDMQYLLEYTTKDKEDTDEYKEYVKYIKMLIKTVKLFMNYIDVSIILCWDNRLNYKDAPIDRGQEIFEQLYKERYFIDDIEELEELIE